MKITWSILLFLLLPVFAFCQLDTTKMLNYFYDANQAEWILESSFEQDFSGEYLTKKEIKTYHFDGDSSYMKNYSIVVNNELGQPLYQVDSNLIKTSSDIYFWEISKMDYTYNEGKISEILIKEKSDFSEERISKKRYNYYSDGLLHQIVKSRLGTYSLEFEYVGANIYEHDTNHCLLSETTHFNNSPLRKVVYEMDENCEVSSKTYFTESSVHNVFNPQQKIDYHIISINQNRLEIDSFFWYSGNKWNHRYTIEREYDINSNLVGRLERIGEGLWDEFFILNFGFPVTQEIYTYSYKNDLVYNEQDWLIEQSQFLYEPHQMDTLFRILTYNHYCNGNIKEAVFENFNLNYPNKKSYFEYRTKEDCGSNSGKIDLTIFPNPTNGQITLQSDALQGSSSVLRVYSLLGQLVYEQALPNQAYELTIDLSHLNGGNYIVSIIGNDFYATEKLVIRPN